MWWRVNWLGDALPHLVREADMTRRLRSSPVMRTSPSAADVYIGPFAYLSADGVPVANGDDSVIGPGSYLLAGDHRFDEPCVAYRDGGRGVNAPVVIGRNVWIGARVTVLKGVTIGDGAIVAA